MIEEKFAVGQSFIHRLDPIVRIIASFVLSIATALSDNLYLAGIYLLIAVLLVCLSRLNPKDVFNRLKPVFWFLLMIWILLPLTFDKETFFLLFDIQISIPGVVLCCKISVKSVTILLLFTALIATMTVASLGHGLHRLKIPDKMVFLLLMSYRYIAVIENEYKRLLRAAKFRGFKPGTNLHSYKTFAYLAGMLFVRASLRANRVYQAMLCRGFNQKFHTLDIYQTSGLNWLFLSCIIGISFGLIIYEHLWIVL